MCFYPNPSSPLILSLPHYFNELNEIEATFKSLKTELGLRPVYHQKEDRVSYRVGVNVQSRVYLFLCSIYVVF
jgi:transposase